MNAMFLTSAAALAAGLFLFAGTTTTPSFAAPIPMGACCSIFNGCCGTVSSMEESAGVPRGVPSNCFQGQSGTCGIGYSYQGDGTLCEIICAPTTTTTLPTGACCSIQGCCEAPSSLVQPNGVGPGCFETSDVICGLGNTYKGDGTTCAAQCSTTTTTIAVVPSACCAANGTCTEVDPAECDGVAQGPGTECATVECTQPTTTTTLAPIGACCLFGGGCNDLSSEECDGVGAYEGDATECASAMCVVPTTTSTTVTTTTMMITTTTTLDETLCGDANGDGDITAPDALLALKTSVGSGTCSLARCDYNGNGDVSASDALAILKKAVGQPIPPMCPN